jgi:hypothetical protein
MRAQVLTLDMAATTEIYILREHNLAVEIGRAEFAKRQEGADVAALDAKIAELRKAVDTPKGDNEPRISIGFLPPAKVSELHHRAMELFRGKDSATLTAVDMDASEDLAREWIRWGVRGHQGMPFPFEATPATWRGKERSLVADSTLEQYEHNGWLPTLERMVIQHNTLSEEKKSP